MKKSLTIGWLYPTLMNIYGDRGNITTLANRCKWQDIDVEIKYLDPGFSKNDLDSCDFLVMGGAQDSQQTIVNKDLITKKDLLKTKIESGTPGLYVCGGFQFLGKYYKEADGTKIDGLGIFDLYTENPGQQTQRLIGNMAFKFSELDYVLIGFENHGGRTHLGKDIEPFGTIIAGFGNNGEDQTEGARYKNSFGTYAHGPLLPKNPKFADYLIKLALEQKYRTQIELQELDDNIENKARMAIANKLNIAI